MIRGVIDTSALVSAVISPTGPNARIVDLVIARQSASLRHGGRLKISEHEDDNRIYECAAAAKADYIITENTKHFKKPHTYTKITTARQLLEQLAGGQA